MYSFFCKEINFLSFTLYLKKHKKKKKKKLVQLIEALKYFILPLYIDFHYWGLPRIFIRMEKEEPRHRPFSRSLPLHAHLSGSSLSSKCLYPPRNLILQVFLFFAYVVYNDLWISNVNTAIISLHIYRFILWDIHVRTRRYLRIIV